MSLTEMRKTARRAGLGANAKNLVSAVLRLIGL